MRATVERRVLAGFRCVDAMSGSSILAALNVTAVPLTIFRNRSGIFAVTNGPEPLRSLTTQFLTSAASWPPPHIRYIGRPYSVCLPSHPRLTLGGDG